MEVMRYHMASFFAGFLLDLWLGDPYFPWHPIRLIGKLISALERRLLKESDKDAVQLCKGAWLAVLVPVVAATVSFSLLFVSYRIHPYAGFVVETVMTYWLLALKCLKAESLKVCKFLEDGDVKQAREAVSMIVGRDTAHLDEEEIVKAAVETVAENTSDGVVAPMLYAALGGPVLGFFYKAVNTMDSMIGYRNKTYFYFGRAAARMDDMMNFIPARLSAGLILVSCFLLGKDFCGKHAYHIYRRDNRKHASPNSAQTESVCAGALGIRLAGDAVYFGKTVKKPYIGDALRKAVPKDIRRANRLLYLSAWICEALCLAFLLFLWKMA